jgi:hypothetical protein
MAARERLKRDNVGDEQMDEMTIARRSFIKGTATAAMAATACMASVRSSHSQQVPFSAGTEQPKLKAALNACDCHMHILDDRFPTRPEAAGRPDAAVRTLNASVDDYRALQKRIGMTRNIVVTATNYGTDNRRRHSPRSGPDRAGCRGRRYERHRR